MAVPELEEKGFIYCQSKWGVAISCIIVAPLLKTGVILPFRRVGTQRARVNFGESGKSHFVAPMKQQQQSLFYFFTF